MTTASAFCAVPLRAASILGMFGMARVQRGTVPFMSCIYAPASTTLANTPSLGKLKAAIEKWAESQGEGEVGSPPSKTFTIDDWQLDIFLFSGFDKDVIPTRAIATSGGDMRRINPAAEIREAAVTKGAAYEPLAVC
ncbi:hypothetical protein ABIF68_010308 [Bradyrhizobium japonicum]